MHHALVTCLPACLPSCLPACLPAGLPACLPACRPACLPACLPAGRPAGLLAYRPAGHLPITCLLEEPLPSTCCLRSCPKTCLQNKEEFISSALDTGAGSLTEVADVSIAGTPQQGTLQQDNSVQTCMAQQNCNTDTCNCAATSPTCLAVAGPAGNAGQCVVSWAQGGSA